MAAKARRLSESEVTRRLDPASLPFESTAEVAPIDVTIGQPRAIDAIEFGLETSAAGFNMYVAGAPGMGKEVTVMASVRRHAESRPTPSDWIYVHNFQSPDEPVAIALPPGGGRSFEASMTGLVHTIQREVARAFESEDVQNRRTAILVAAGERRATLLERLQTFARDRHFGLELSPAGAQTTPLADGKPMDSSSLAKLTDEERADLVKRSEELQAELVSTMREIRVLERESVEQLRQLEREVMAFLTDPLFADVADEYRFNVEIVQYLADLQKGLPDHLADFFPADESRSGGTHGAVSTAPRSEHLARYHVNVLVDHGETDGAPVVFERNPTLSNLQGRIEYRPTMGTLVTDFREIKAGALHRANGGYLIVDMVDILRNPMAWDMLKRALNCGEIAIDTFFDNAAMAVAGRLRPEPILLNVKVIAIGPWSLYQVLIQADPDFAELFAVRADFAPEMTWNEEHIADYASFISRQVRDRQLIHFSAAAVASVVEFGARQLEHQKKLTTRFLDITNLVIEASHWAGKAGHDPVMTEDVERGLEARTHRSNMTQTRYEELILDRTVGIATDGEVVGQVNGLSVIDLGDYAFGRPSRITATVAPGRGSVQSVERAIELSGPIHSKGVLTLSGYLSGKYGESGPLSLNATVTFEQMYGPIDGDSASSTELYALLSALSGLPLKQAIAVTGSVDQFGRVQAVGGVTKKIEGYFDICQQRGLSGEQGVLVPAANVKNLMVRSDVAAAVTQGSFNLWSVETIDEGIELLTGVPAGERDADGRFPDGSVHARVLERLGRFAEFSNRQRQD